MKIKSIFITIVIVFWVLVFQGLSYSQETKIHLRVGYTPLISQLPVIVSHNDDQFRLKKIGTSMSKFNSFNSLEAALRVEAIDAAFIPIPMALRMAADGVPIKILGSMSTGGSLLISRKPGDYSSLRSKLIGIPGLDSNENVRLKEVMSSNKLRYGLDYKVIDIPFYTALDDLKYKRVDALYLPEPYPSIALSKGYGTVVFNGSKKLSGGVMTVLVVKEKFLEEKSAIKEWLTSMVRACKKLREFSTGEKLKYSIPFEFAPEIVESSIKKKMGGIDFHPIIPDVNSIREYLEETIDLKILLQSIAVDNLIEAEFLMEVVKEESNDSKGKI